MNILEQYRDREAKAWSIGMSDTESAYQEGFDIAIALELPVKFAEWKEQHPFDMKNRELWLNIMNVFHKECLDISTKELYQYWIDNIYKLD